MTSTPPLPTTLPPPISWKNTIQKVSGLATAPAVDFDPPVIARFDKPLPAIKTAVLNAALRVASQFQDSWGIAELPFGWEADGSRTWEDEACGLYLADAEGFARRVEATPASRDTLAGEESQFAIHCDC